jgi:hypothetical protein
VNSLIFELCSGKKDPEESEREVDRIYTSRGKTPNVLTSGEKEERPAT